MSTPFTLEMGLVLGLVGLTFWLFLSERYPIDVSAMIILVLLGLASELPGLQPLFPAGALFSGLSSTAVIAIIALTIMAAGLERNGVMEAVAGGILRASGKRERLAMLLTCGSAGLLSGFIQNIGVVALYIPVVAHLCKRTALPLQQLLMPVGFCVMLGGNLTLFGNSSLIMLNDLISGMTYPGSELPLPKLHLFAPAPVALVMLVLAVTVFILFRQHLFGHRADAAGLLHPAVGHTLQKPELDFASLEFPAAHAWQAHSIDWLQEQFGIRVLAHSPISEALVFPAQASARLGQSRLAIAGAREEIERLTEAAQVRPRTLTRLLGREFGALGAGVSEIVVGSEARLGQVPYGVRQLKADFGMTLLSLQRGAEFLSGTALAGADLRAGDVLHVFSARHALDDALRGHDFILVQTDCPAEPQSHRRPWLAAGILAGSLFLAMGFQLPTSLSLWCGVTAMLVAGLLKPPQAYRAVSWRTVFLLGGLIPLGIAVDHTGLAEWLALLLLAVLPDHAIVIQATVAIIASALSLIMSNVGATVLMVPLAVTLAGGAGIDPMLMILLVGLSTSNSFILPTHQANALIMAAGNYPARAFMRIGGGVTLAYLAIELLVLNLLFPG